MTAQSGSPAEREGGQAEGDGKRTGVPAHSSPTAPSAPPVWIDPEMCKRCGTCVRACVRQIIVMEETSARVARPERCCLCGHCSAVCPENAVHILDLDLMGFEKPPPAGDLPTPGQLLNLFRRRRSVRVFRRQMVSRTNLKKVLDAGSFAPSGSNRQPLQFLVRSLQGDDNPILNLTRQVLADFEDRIRKECEHNHSSRESVPAVDQELFSYQQTFYEVVEAYARGQDRIYWQAPTLVVCHLPPLASAFPHIDAGVAVMQMLLMADALGLGACICGLATIAISKSNELRAALGLPEENLVPICFVIGHPAVRYRKLIPHKSTAVQWG